MDAEAAEQHLARRVLASFDDDLAQAIARIGARRQQAPGDLAVDRRRYAGAPEPAGAAGQQQGDGRDGSAAPGDALPARRGPAARGLRATGRGAARRLSAGGLAAGARASAPRSMASGFKRRIARSPPSSRRDRESRCRDGGLLRHQRERRHAGLGVDLQQIEPVEAGLRVVVAEIGAGDAAAAERADARRPPCSSPPRLDLRRHRRRDQMLGLALGVFRCRSRRSRCRGRISVTAERLVAHDGDGQLAAGDIALDQHLVAEGPVPAASAAAGCRRRGRCARRRSIPRRWA